MKAAAKAARPTPALEGASVIRLGQILDLNAAGPLASELLAVRGAPVEIDASAVARMGAQCLQVLLSARLTWDADGASFSVVAPSDEFTSTLALLGAPNDLQIKSRELA